MKKMILLSNANILLILIVIINYASCVSVNPWQKFNNRYNEVFRETETTLLEKYKETDFVLWSSNTDFLKTDPQNVIKLVRVDISIDNDFEPGDYAIQGLYVTDYFKYTIELSFLDVEETIHLYEVHGTAGSNRYPVEKPLAIFKERCIELLETKYLINLEKNGIDITHLKEYDIFLVKNNSLQIAYDSAPDLIEEQSERNAFSNLIRNLLDAADPVGHPFKAGEKVAVPQALLTIIDSDEAIGGDLYLVSIRGTRMNLKPFYIKANRTFSLMNFDGGLTIFEPLILEYIGRSKYSQNGIPRDTLLFGLVN